MIRGLKPSKTIKTISEWTYGVDKKLLRKTPRQGRLFVHTEPKGAKVRILNIKPKFYQGIVLITGPYHIEVSADGYEMESSQKPSDSLQLVALRRRLNSSVLHEIKLSVV